MLIKKTLNHIHKQPEHIRRTIAIVITAIIGVTLLILWGVSIVNQKFNITKTDIHNINFGNPSADGSDYKDQISSIIDNANANSFEDNYFNTSEMTPEQLQTLEQFQSSPNSSNSNSSNDTSGLFDETNPFSEDISN